MSCVLDSNDIRRGGYFDELYAIESSVYEFCHLSQQGSNRLYQSAEKDPLRLGSLLGFFVQFTPRSRVTVY